MSAKRILIVEDSPVLAEGLKSALTSAGYDVTVAESATRAKELAGEEFDLYLYRSWTGSVPETFGSRLRFHGMELDPGTRTATLDDRTVSLSKSEFDILRLLVRRNGEVASREALLDAVDPDGEALDRAIDSHLSRLRGKFRKAGIIAVRIVPAYGLGYRLEWKG